MARGLPRPSGGEGDRPRCPGPAARIPRRGALAPSQRQQVRTRPAWEFYQAAVPFCHAGGRERRRDGRASVAASGECPPFGGPSAGPRAEHVRGCWVSIAAPVKGRRCRRAAGQPAPAAGPPPPLLGAVVTEYSQGGERGGEWARAVDGAWPKPCAEAVAAALCCCR